MNSTFFKKIYLALLLLVMSYIYPRSLLFYEFLNLPYCWSLNLFVILTDHNKIPSPPCYHLFLTCHSIKTDLYLTNPLHPYINVQVLLAIPYTFPIVLTRRICLRIKFRIIAFILTTVTFDSGVILFGEIRCLSLKGNIVNSKSMCPVRKFCHKK